jgi:hypothetical protein
MAVEIGCTLQSLQIESASSVPGMLFPSAIAIPRPVFAVLQLESKDFKRRSAATPAIIEWQLHPRADFSMCCSSTSSVGILFPTEQKNTLGY